MISLKPISIKVLIESPLHYLRYGDGSWIVMLQRGTHGRKMPLRNCDGHAISLPGLRNRMLMSVREPRTNIQYGLTEYSIECFESDIKKTATNIEWYDGDIWLKLYKNKLPSRLIFINYIKEQRTCFVGPPWLSKLGFCDHHLITYRDSYLQFDEIRAWLIDNREKYKVVIFAAGFLTQVLIWDLAYELCDKKMIDVGAFLDSFCDVKSRTFHNKGVKKLPPIRRRN